ncbi:MAG: hypothetical protein R3F50_11065 [Gammaproteobacteria bacterium]|jgi:Mrp family chromosome partitioning ATPase
MIRKRLNFESKKAKAAFLEAHLGFNASKLTGNPGDGVVVGFISRLPGEGVSTTVTGLARSLGALSPGSILIIDANPTGTRIAKLLESGAKNPLTSASFDRMDFSILNHLETIENGDLALITIDYETSENYCLSAEFGQYLVDLREHYDTILVDIGSWDQLAPVYWADFMDHLVLIIDSERTTRESLEDFKHKLDRSGHELSGFILNKQERPVPEFIYRSL